MNTKIISNAKNDDNFRAEMLFAANVIKSGGLVVFPTETVYGLGADATNDSAVGLVYEAKGRPSDNPLIIHVARPQDVEPYAYTDTTYYRLAEKFMPGPLTVILRSKDAVPSKTRGGLDTVAVRCPSNDIARELISLSGVPIAAPSANLSGTPSPTSFSHVVKDMNGRVDVIIDGGECDFGLESTIVKIEDDTTLTLLRPGKITVDDLLSVVDAVKVADSVTDKLKDGELVLSPGMKYKHYAPRASLVLLDGTVEEMIRYILSKGTDTTAIISYSENISQLQKYLPGVRAYDFGGQNDREAHARRLFSILRETDNENYSVIYAPLPETEGIGLALYNRMIRAAAHKIIRLKDGI